MLMNLQSLGGETITLLSNQFRVKHIYMHFNTVYISFGLQAALNFSNMYSVYKLKQENKNSLPYL